MRRMRRDLTAALEPLRARGSRIRPPTIASRRPRASCAAPSAPPGRARAGAATAAELRQRLPASRRRARRRALAGAPARDARCTCSCWSAIRARPGWCACTASAWLAAGQPGPLRRNAPPRPLGVNLAFRVLPLHGARGSARMSGGELLRPDYVQMGPPVRQRHPRRAQLDPLAARARRAPGRPLRHLARRLRRLAGGSARGRPRLHHRRHPGRRLPEPRARQRVMGDAQRSASTPSATGSSCAA